MKDFKKNWRVWLVVGTVAFGAAGFYFLSFWLTFTAVVELGISFDVDPRGEEVAFVGSDGQLYACSLEDKSVRVVGQGPEAKGYPDYSPDGSQIVFCQLDGSGASSLYLVPRKGGAARQLTRLKANDGSAGKGKDEKDVDDRHPSFSPDGNRIAFVRSKRVPGGMGIKWHEADVFVLETSTGMVRQVTKEAYRDISGVDFAPDGQSMIFAANSSGKDYRQSLYSVPLDAERPTPTVIGQGSDPAVDDGTGRVTFVSDRAKAFAYDIYLSDAARKTSHALNLVKVSTYNECPKFAADGQSVLALGTTGVGSAWEAISLYRVRPGAQPEVVIESGVFRSPKAWMKQASGVVQGR